MLSVEGYCKKCGDYEMVSKDKRSCIPAVCDNFRQKITPLGTCETCEDYSIVSSD